MWNLPRSGIEPMFPALQGGFLKPLDHQGNPGFSIIHKKWQHYILCSNFCAFHFFFLSYWFLDIMFSNVSPQNSKILKMLQGSCKYLPTFESSWSFKIQLDLGIETLLVHSPCSSLYFAFSSPFYIPFSHAETDLCHILFHSSFSVSRGLESLRSPQRTKGTLRNFYCLMKMSYQNATLLMGHW